MSAAFTVLRAQIRYWRGHRLQVLLCLSGIVLGVAVFMAILLANRGALESFTRGIADLTGRATHRIIHPAGSGVPEQVFVTAARYPGVLAAAPFLRTGARAGTRSVTVLGIDPVTDLSFREFRFTAASGPGSEQNGARATRLLERLIAQPGAVLLPRTLATSLDISLGRPMTLQSAGRTVSLVPIGFFDVPPKRAVSFGTTLLTDISTFQERFGRLGRLDAIDLIVKPEALEGLRAALPSALRLEPAGSGMERVRQMSQAFRFNLQALGGFALLVAMFLIFNAATFSVVQRGHAIAVMRCIGASRRGILWALMCEAGILGVVGGVLGVLLGRLAAGWMVENTAATLYEVILFLETPALGVSLSFEAWAIGISLSIGAALAGALWPALEAARMPPLAAMRGSRGLPEIGSRLRIWTLGSLVCLVAAGALTLPAEGPLLAGIAGAAALALAGAMLCPLALVACSRVAAPLLGRLAGPAARMAGRNLGRSVTRTGLATASLMVALALALAIEITVGSFRDTFVLYLNQTIRADLYLGPAEHGDELARLTPDRLATLRALPFVQDLAELKSRRVLFAGREVVVVGIDLDTYVRQKQIPLLGSDPESLRDGLLAGGVLISETLALPLKLGPGDRIDLPTPSGIETLTIAGVVQDYSVPSGIVYFTRQRFTRYFGATPTERAGIWLRPGTSPAQATATLEALPWAHRLVIQNNAAIREEALAIFDRTFIITDLLGALAAVIAFIAVVSALTALLEERMRLLGYMRAIGVSARRLGQSLAIEAMLIALVASAMSWITGVAMSMVLVFVLNPSAFGWSLQFHPGHGSYMGLMLAAVLAALLGSLYPIHRATRRPVAATIREE